MRKIAPARLLLPLALVFVLSQFAPAQTRDVSKFVTAQTRDTRAALASFPDSQAVLFVNARRIVNEVLPRLMPPAEYQKLVGGAEKGGFDLRALDYAAVGIRFPEPAPVGGVPEFVVVVRGGFNADTLLALGRVGISSMGVKPRQESYGSKTIEIIDTSEVAKMAGVGEAASTTPYTQMGLPSKIPYPEIGVVALDSETLVFGVPAYVKSAIDAAGGRGGLKSSTLDLAARDPQALWSLTADIPPSLSDTIHKFGAPPNEELDRMLSWIKQVSVSQGMNAVDYTLSASVLTDAPEHASAFSGLIRMGLLAVQTGLGEEAAKQNGKDAANARRALEVLKTVVNRTEGNTLVVSASVSQAAVAEMIKEQTAKPAVTKPRTTRRTTRRRARRRH
ncbi:MAG TPA: hypothetical protein VFA21_11845 [Pyrinomonadaceae bacterium]|jgi:hypothetical protein|nr:hypothetical protein [Pyrinomonadaceae bacterium]